MEDPKHVVSNHDNEPSIPQAPMTIEELAAIGELIGGIGVLATLLFLTIEVRRNSKILRMNAQTAGMESFAGYNECVAADLELSELFDRLFGGEMLSSFSSIERFRMTLAIRGLIQRMEAQFFQYKGGLIDEQYWTQRMKWLRGFLIMPELEGWWEIEGESAQLTEEFVRHVNSSTHSLQMGQAGQVKRDA